MRELGRSRRRAATIRGAARAGRFLLCAAVFGTSLTACGGSADQSPPTVPTGPAQQPSKPLEKADAPEVLPEAPAPEDLFVRGRFKNPKELLDRSVDWLHLPIPWQELLSKKAPYLVENLELGAPMDLAITLDPESLGRPEPLMAFSVGLNNFDQTLHSLRSAGRNVERVSRNVHFFSMEGSKCVVARANGLAPARLICSDERKSLDVLAPFMARTMPTKSFGEQDVFLQLEAEPLRRRFGKKAHMAKMGIPMLLREFALDNAKFDAALSDAAHGVVDEFLLLIDEVDRLEATLWVRDERNMAELELGLYLKEGRSFTAKSLKAAAGDAGPAPESFWRLPKDIDGGSYASAVGDISRFQPIVETISGLLSGGMEHLGLPQGTLSAWVSAHRDAWSTKGPTVYGYGRLPEGKDQKKPKEMKKGELAERVIRHSIGYHLMGFDADEGRIAKLLDQTVKVFNDGKLRAFVSKQGAEELKHLPTFRSSNAGHGLPKGSKSYAITFTPATVKKLTGEQDLKGLGTIKGYILVVPDGQRTWVGVSTDEQVLASKLKLALQAPSKDSLQGREGLESFKTVKAGGAAFLTIAGSLASMKDAAAAEGDINMDQVLLAMPNKGRSPIIYRSIPTADGPAQKLRLEAPKAAIEDLAAALVSAAAQSGDSLF